MTILRFRRDFRHFTVQEDFVGQQHFQVLKGLVDGRTSIQVQEISGEDRVIELATMLGGPSDKNLESARELMDYISKVIQ